MFNHILYIDIFHVFIIFHCNIVISSPPIDIRYWSSLLNFKQLIGDECPLPTTANAPLYTQG